MIAAILIRHGNTFAPGESAVWVGARTDLPLVEKGLQQAREMAVALAALDILPARLLTGPLRRTRQTAEIIGEKLGLADKIETDDRLAEIDYGTWEGKSNDEIAAQGDASAMDAWNKNAIFPLDAGWSSGEAQLIENSAAILNEATINTIIVTSNGILRFFVRAATNAADYPDRKVLTGHACVMRQHEDGWRIMQWNVPPERLRL